MTEPDDDPHAVEAFADEVDDAVCRALEAGGCGGCMVGALLEAVAMLIATDACGDRAEMELQVQMFNAGLSRSVREILDDLGGMLH